MLNRFFDKFIFTNNLKFVHNNFYMANEPFIVCPLSLATSLMTSKDEEFCRKVYYTIKEHVKDQIKKNSQIEFKSKDEMMNFWLEYLSYSGWGQLHLVNINYKEKQAIVGLVDNPFTVIIKNPTENADHLMRAMLAAIFSNVLEDNIDCVETKCALNNEKECHFILKKEEEFDYSKPESRKQLNQKI